MGSVVAGVIWAFRQGWGVSAAAGVETWLAFSFLCLIHLFVFDTVTGFIPAQYMAYFALTWIIINATSCIIPLELAPGFYRWHYALPSYEVFQLLTTIWSDGCVNTTAIALPVLFVWLILGMIGSWASMIQKCNAATKLEDEEEHILGEMEYAEDEMQGSSDLEKVKTAQDEDSADDKIDFQSATRSSRPHVSREVSAASRARTELRKFEATPFQLSYAFGTPFQNSLGLTPARTAPARAGMRRTISSPVVQR